MLRILILALSLAFASGAAAQLYRWVDKDGRVRYTDTPPPAGVPARTLQAPSAPPSAASAPEGEAKPAASLSEQEQAFRKRRLEAQKAAEKDALAQKEAEAKRQNCARAQEYLRTLESGQRVTRTNAQGEREFIDDATRARETASARQAVRDWCE